MADLRICVLGDAMLDVWVEGESAPCPDGCPAFREGPTVITPGGAANAARQLDHWPGVEVQLIGPVDRDVRHALVAKTQVRLDYAFTCPQNPVKRRCLDSGGRVLWRCDREAKDHGWRASELRECQTLATKAVRECRWDAVLLSDYGKGFVSVPFAHGVITECLHKGVPVVADSKLPLEHLEGAILQANAGRAANLGWSRVQEHRPAAVVTCGAEPPLVFGEESYDPGPPGPPVVCRNHIGAGDCFGAWLAYGLVAWDDLDSAARMAHSAGRVFVQHPYGRSPWPHEVYRDLHPTGGKVLNAGEVEALRKSLVGKKVVFTNGVFRVPHAGHCWLLEWARRQGDVLVVGINDDASAARQRPGKRVLPLEQRVEVLAGLACVDWVVPFAEDTPEAIMGVLRPDVLVKGSEYCNNTVPGMGLVAETKFAPEGPYPWHCTDLEAALSRGSSCS